MEEGIVKKRERIDTYNALRGIGAIGILFSHMAYLGDADNSFLAGCWHYFMRYGSRCTTFFFLCSGFFLAYSWKNQSYGKYVKEKLKRIYPLTLLVFVLAVMVDIILSGSNVVSEGVELGSPLWIFNLAANLFLFKAFVPDRRVFYSFHGPSWYISALFAFYLIAYVFVRGIKSEDEKKQNKWLKIMWAGCITAYAVELLICITVHFTQSEALYLCYVNPWFRIFGEGFAGILLCRYMPQIQEKIKEINIGTIENAAIITVVGTLLLCNAAKWNVMDAWFWIIPMGLVLIAFFTGKGMISGVLKGRTWQFIGNISFELYMTHAFVYEGIPVAAGIISNKLQNWIIIHAGSRFVVTFFASILFAWMVHRAFRIRAGKI